MPAKNKYDPTPDSSPRLDAVELLESPRRLEERVGSLKRRYAEVHTRATACTSHLSFTGSGSGSSCRRMEDLVLELVMLEAEIKSLRTRQRERICEIGRVLALMDDPASVRLLRERCVGLKTKTQMAREYGCSEHRIRDLLTKAGARFAEAYTALQNSGNGETRGKHEEHGTHGDSVYPGISGNRSDRADCVDHEISITIR